MTEPSPRLYLDHASTSWPKAAGVVDAMSSFLKDFGASNSRGHYAAARYAQQLVDQVRRKLAERIDAEDPSCVTFHPGCTAALNAAIHGIVRPGDHVVASSIEHNSVLRPLAEATRVTPAAASNTTMVPCDASGDIDVDRMVESIGERTRMVALAHASNVTGLVQRVSDLSSAIASINRRRSQDHRIWFICDAAQTLGYIPVSVKTLGVDILAAPAHKGCGGPPGIGLLYLTPELHSIVRPTVQGGSGQDGLSDAMPVTMPGRLEAGTMNVPAIAGWDAALDSFPDFSNSEVACAAMSRLTHRLRDGLEQVAGVRVVGRQGDLPIASIDFGPDLPPSDAAAILDHEFSIDVRAGYHCASQVHECLGTQAAGTLRISCGHSTTLEDIDRLVDAVAAIADSLHSMTTIG